MIARVWRGRTSRANADRYLEHVTGRVSDALRALPGFLGLAVLRRDTAEAVELVVITRWTSIDAVTAFAGPQPDVAVVEPVARALLIDFDASVSHYDIAFES